MRQEKLLLPVHCFIDECFCSVEMKILSFLLTSSNRKQSFKRHRPSRRRTALSDSSERAVRKSFTFSQFVFVNIRAMSCERDFVPFGFYLIRDFYSRVAGALSAIGFG